MVNRLVEYPLAGMYINLEDDDFGWDKKTLTKRISQFYWHPNLYMKQSCASKGSFSSFKFFSFAEHGHDSEITICLNNSCNVKEIMHTWKMMSESEWKDITKNEFLKELTIILYHEYTHELQSRRKNVNISIGHVEKDKEDYGLYLSDFNELQAFAIESAFTKRTFGHFSPIHSTYKKYPVLWKYYKKELERWL